MEHSPILIFAVKALITTAAFLICIITPIVVVKKMSPSDKDTKKLKIKNLKKQYDRYIQQFKAKTLDKKEFKKYLKALHKDEKNQKKQASKPNLFVLSFTGDIMASQASSLREEVSLILQLAKPKDEAALILESRGGSVAHYGLAANQLQRLRSYNIPLTVCVDKIAGSGGYLMACVGNQILSSPFAFVGSIGVLFGLPNIHDFLKKHDVHYEEITAGKYKRTLTPLGKVTEEKRQRLKEQLELIHNQFKSFIKQYRDIDLEQAATGEAWTAQEALKRKLVDKLQCSDDFLLEKRLTHNVYMLSLKKPKSFIEKILEQKSFAKTTAENFLNRDFII